MTNRLTGSITNGYWLPFYTFISFYWRGITFFPPHSHLTQHTASQFILVSLQIGGKLKTTKKNDFPTDWLFIFETLCLPACRRLRCRLLGVCRVALPVNQNHFPHLAQWCRHETPRHTIHPSIWKMNYRGYRKRWKNTLKLPSFFGTTPQSQWWWANWTPLNLFTFPDDKRWLLLSMLLQSNQNKLCDRSVCVYSDICWHIPTLTNSPPVSRLGWLCQNINSSHTINVTVFCRSWRRDLASVKYFNCQESRLSIVLLLTIPPPFDIRDRVLARIPSAPINTHRWESNGVARSGAFKYHISLFNNTSLFDFAIAP